MRYRVRCLTPLLVGDGRRLAPVDYMVWKDQVNVLDQRRIFSLLARGPRLEGYLAQLKKTDRLDFSSWGGFAQNFAGRRIPFEHPSLTRHWEKAPLESLHIPTFTSGPQGPYLPASALRGALRTGIVAARAAKESLEKIAARMEGERPPRHPAEELENAVLGTAGADRMRVTQFSDSAQVDASCFKVFLLRIAALLPQSRGGGFALGWKQSPRGYAPGASPHEGAPLFAEMAVPGTVFEGEWKENTFLRDREVARALNWENPLSVGELLAAANSLASALLLQQKRYAELAGLSQLRQEMDRLGASLETARQRGNQCLLCMGWGGGLLARLAWLETDDPAYRRIAEKSKVAKSVHQGLPLPKTRRVVFMEDRPATLPGWVVLELGS